MKRFSEYVIPWFYFFLKICDIPEILQFDVKGLFRVNDAYWNRLEWE